MRGRDLTTGAIPAHTWALAWPVMLSIFFQTMYQAVDAFWVSQLADEALAAVNMSQIALFASVSLTIGITVGSGVLMAMSIGARAVDEAERILGQSFVLNFIAAVVLTALVLALRTPILRAVGATDAIYPLAKDYLTITASAMVLMFLFFAAVFGFNSQGRQHHRHRAVRHLHGAEHRARPAADLRLCWAFRGSACGAPRSPPSSPSSCCWCPASRCWPRGT